MISNHSGNSCANESSQYSQAPLSIYTDNGVKTLSGRFRENDSQEIKTFPPPVPGFLSDSFLSPSPPGNARRGWGTLFSSCFPLRHNEQLKVFRREDTCRPAGGIPASPHDENKGIIEAGSRAGMTRVVSCLCPAFLGVSLAFSMMQRSCLCLC